MSNPINNQQNPYSTPTDSYAPTSGTNTMPSNTTQPNPYISNPTATTMGSNEPPAYTAAANTTAATTGKTTGEKAKGLAHTIKHGITAVHGIGEEARGRFNGAIDGAFHDTEGVARDRYITNDGILEQESGKFATGTKAREGFDPATKRY